MMRRGGGRRFTRFEDEEDERVVYYDLDTDSHSRDLLLSPDAVPTPTQPRETSTEASKGGTQIFARQQRPLFNLDDSGDDAEQEEENPFASLLQQQQKTATPPANTDETPTGAAPHTSLNNSFLQPKGRVAATSSAAAQATKAQGTASRLSSDSRANDRRSILKRRQPQNGSAVGSSTISKKKLGFEAANSRPARWSTNKPSAADTKNRRKSLSAIKQRRSQLEAATAKRRKSMPPTLSGSPPPRAGYSQDSTTANSPAIPKKRLLSEVLQRATVLSQQLNSSRDEAVLSQTPANENSTVTDTIMDTDQQMRTEAFATQIFSPTKPSTSGPAIGRKLKSDAIAPKIRGGIGDVIRKAIRKNNRDLTLLRSEGQHLLPQHSSHSSSREMVGAVESIRERDYIVICLNQSRAVTSNFSSYECQIHKISAKLKGNTAEVMQKEHSIVFEALFQPQTAQTLKLHPGSMVKIYEPLHFIAELAAAGATSKPKWFLLCTQLAEVIEPRHQS